MAVDWTQIFARHSCAHTQRDINAVLFIAMPRSRGFEAALDNNSIASAFTATVHSESAWRKNSY
ncbi:UNVERIFIED_CONTAM: hypothetical protein FKN15_050350 [Acipenser sinensis]